MSYARSSNQKAWTNNIIDNSTFIKFDVSYSDNFNSELVMYIEPLQYT